METGTEAGGAKKRRMRGWLDIGSSGLLIVSERLTQLGLVYAREADRAYINGNFYAVGETFSTASAVAVKEGGFIYAGDDARRSLACHASSGCYSTRNASCGSIRHARRVGAKHAKTPTATRTKATIVNVAGSRGET